MLTDTEAFRIADTLNEEQAALLLEIDSGLNRMLNESEVATATVLEALTLIRFNEATGARKVTDDGETIAHILR